MVLSPKENLLMCIKGEVPERVPVITPDQNPPLNAMVAPGFLSGHFIRGGGKDIWGVEYIPTESTGNALIPSNREFILDDIRKWRDVIKAPDLSGMNWEKMCADDMKRVDRSKSVVSLTLHFGYFQLLMSFMGFTNGLCALYEEAEEVKALFEYLCDFYCEVGERYAEYCQPDIWSMADDTAAWANPFISPEMYSDFLTPLYDRQAKFARDRGITISMHNCGKSACFLDDLVKIGVSMWDPAQTCNDLAAVKKRYGNKLIIAGGWDARDNLLEEDVTYEEIYDSVKRQMDLLAPGGGYCFMGAFLGYVGDQNIVNKNRMLSKAAEELSGMYY